MSEIYTKKEVSRPKWQTVLDAALAGIEEGGAATGARFYTVKELCAKYEISVITAQRVFRELDSRGVIATDGRRGTRVVGGSGTQIVNLCLRDDYFSSGAGWIDRFQTVQRFIDGFRSAGVSGAFEMKYISLAFLCEHLREFAGQHMLISADSFLDIAPRGISLNAVRFERLRKALNPIIFHSFGAMPSPVTQVGADLYAGIRRAVSHLVETGHIRLGFMSGDPGNVWFRSRHQAFMDGLFEHGLPFHPEWMKLTSGDDKEEDFRALDSIWAQRERPTAIVCGNDARALHLLDFCRTRGLRVPDDLAATGFDNIPESAVSSPSLTTVDGNDLEQGRKTAELLWRRVCDGEAEPVDVKIDLELIVRQSTTKTRSSAV